MIYTETVKDSVSLEPSACPGCGRDSCSGCNAAESLDSLLARLDNTSEPSPRIAGLWPQEGIAAWAGRPRVMKSLTGEEVALSYVLGEPFALGNPRFTIAQGGSVLWVSGEDSERTIGSRARLLLAARDNPPLEKLRNFRVRVARGMNLETSENQDALIAMIHDTSRSMATPPEVGVFDPSRAFFPGFDGGPKDGYPGRAALERIRKETGLKLLVLLVHETKPSRTDKDTRAHAERASGGIIFSLADAPVSFERRDDRTTFATPSMFKFSADPAPFLIRFESASPQGEPFRDYVRAIAEDVGIQEVNADLDLKILRFLNSNPNASTSEVVTGAGAKAEVVAARLHALDRAGRIRLTTGPAARALGRKSTAKLWEVTA